MRIVGCTSLASLLLVSALAACGDPPPDRYEMVPPGPFKLLDVGATATTRAEPYRGRVAWQGKDAPAIAWSSSNPAVVTVAGGVITAVGSGSAKVTASSGEGATKASGDVDVRVEIVGSIEITGTPPARMSADARTEVKLGVVVKDEKGNAIDKPRVHWKASDYCVEVTDGVVNALAVGECDVIAEASGKSARLHFDVK